MIFHAFLIKYAEIAIKGKNRYIFEDALVKQMNIALSKVEGEFEVKKEQGRIYVFCPEQYDYDETVEALQPSEGIRYCWNLPCSDLRRSGIRADGKGRSFLHEELPSELRRKFQSIYKKSKEILSDHIHGS